MTTASPKQQISFLRDLQTILDGGQFVASYKFALLMSLAEISIESQSAQDEILRITLDQLSERFIEIYWRQAAPFRGHETLWQTTGTQAVIISMITRARAGYSNLAQARRSPVWFRLVKRSREILLDQPLWRLQRVGARTLVCLYEPKLDNDAIVLKPGVAACFRALYGTVQALVQLAWLRYVQNLPRNQALLGAGNDVAEFLFGADRSCLTPLRNGLKDLQLGKCFYCQTSLGDKMEVDHFIPWTRYPRDLGHNFVLAHRACNNSKRDLLADIPHLERWVIRNYKANNALNQLFDDLQLQHEKETSMHVAEWCYASVAETAGLVWSKKDHFLTLDSNWRHALSSNAFTHS